MNKTKKIAYCIPSLYIHGGMERVISKKASYFADALGYEVYIIMTDAKGKKPFFPLSTKIHLIQLDENFEELWCKPLWKRTFLYLKHMHGYKKKLRDCLMKIRPDITISTLRREINFLCDIPDGSKKIGELHINREEFRNLNQDKGSHILKDFIQDIWNKQLIKALKKLDKFIVLTKKDKEKWIELDSDKVIAINNPLSFYSIAPVVGNAKSVAAVGRFCYQKGFDLLIQTWEIVSKHHPDWTLNIYGDDGDKIRHYIAEHNMNDYIYLHGITADMESALKENSIFVLSSRFEGFGMVITEAMACGIPPVSFDCHFGPSDIIKDGEDGLLAKPKNINDLADKICYLIENDDIRIKMGQAAYKNITRYKIENIGKQWDSLFTKLIQ